MKILKSVKYEVHSILLLQHLLTELKMTSDRKKMDREVIKINEMTKDLVSHGL